MKTAKRVLALLLAVLMLTGGMTFAAGAAYDLQAAIDGAAAGDTVTLPEDVTASVVIDKDLTLDLGGYELTGVEGEIAITVKNADVTVRNGHVYSKFADVRSVELVKTVATASPAAIRVIGGSLTAEGLRVVGSFARIPTTTKYHLPTGSAIEAIDGAEVTVIQSSLVGRYGVNNKVNNSAPGGKVTIEDGILMAFMSAVKDDSKVVLAEGTEDVNGADRIEGFLNSGIKLEERERALMKTLLADRLHIYTKSVSENPEGIVLSDEGAVKMTAKVDDSRVWENNTSTDASYKLVPEAVAAGEELIAMTEDGDAYTAELTAEQAKADLQVKYRVEFVLQSDVQGVLNNFDQYLELLYAGIVKTVNEVYDYALEKYNTYMLALYNVSERLMTMDGDIYGLFHKHTYEIPEFINLTTKLFALGGAAMVNKGEFTGQKLPTGTEYGYTNVLPESDPADGVYGVLDRVAKLKKELDVYMPLKADDQSKWPEMVKWAYDNYEEVLALLDDGEAAILDVKEALNTGSIPQIMELAPEAQQQAAKLDTALDYIDTLQSARDLLLADSTVQTVLEKLKSNESEIIPYTQKFIGIYNNHSTYFTPEKFLLENGTVGKAYAVYAEPHIFSAWQYADDNAHISVCSVCGEIREEQHDYQEDVAAFIPATDEAPGQRTLICVGCGHVIYKVVPQLPHTHNHNDVVYTPATCTEDAYWTYTCKCGDSYTEIEEGSALDHDFDQGEVTTPADCYNDGEITFTCSRCGLTRTEAMPSPGHRPLVNSRVVDEPTCTEGGEIYCYCAVCNIKIIEEEFDPLGHDYADVTIREATCEKDGLMVKQCRRCGDTTGQTTVPATGHKWGEVLVTKEPDCTTPGEMVYICEYDSNHTSAPIEIPALGHKYESKTIQPTCENYGYTQTICANCGDELERTDIFPKLGHRWNEGTRDKEPTCTEPGVMTFICMNDVTHEKQEPINPIGHQWVLDEEHSVAADCTHDGRAVYYCAHNPEHILNGDTYDDFEKEYEDHPEFYPDGLPEIVIPALGHKLERKVVEPTCDTEGYTTFVCSRCGREVGEHTNVRDALGHQFKGTVIKEPGCVDEGEMRYVCEHDHSHIIDADNYDQIKADFAAHPELYPEGLPKVVIPALGHKWVDETGYEDVIVVKPTCTEWGYSEYTCLRCGETDKRVDEDNDKPLGHDWVRADKPLEEATCEDPDLWQYTCSRDPNHTKIEAGHALGHDWIKGELVTEATCDKAATYRFTCSHDVNHTKVDAYGDPLGHAWKTVEVLKEPTCTEDGVYRQICENDVNHKRTHVVPAYGHDFDSSSCRTEIVVKATYATKGTKKVFCCNCNEAYVLKEYGPLDIGNARLNVKESTGGKVGSHEKPLVLEIPFTRKNFVATTLSAADPEEGWKLSFSTSDSKALKVDEFGNVRFTGLSLFHRKATITVTGTLTGKDASGNTKTVKDTVECTIHVKYRWFHYLLWALFGCIWY